MCKESIKVRIVKDSSGFGYWGEIYTTWYYKLTGRTEVAWGTVTGWCLTKRGAKRGIKKYMKNRGENTVVEEFEL